MGLDVELVWYSGDRRTAQWVSVADTRFRFATAVERAQRLENPPAILDRIDLYSSLELPSTDMPELLDALDELLAAAPDDREREVLLAVRGLAERCRDDEELLLHFIGD